VESWLGFESLDSKGGGETAVVGWHMSAHEGRRIHFSL
jgi:hypothetical protein